MVLLETAVPDFRAYVTEPQLDAVIRQARDEDLGDPARDITTRAFIADDRCGRGSLVCREAGRLAGIVLLPHIARAYDRRIDVQAEATDGQPIAVGQIIARYVGPLDSILTMERVALNFVAHLCGVATLTAQFVERTRQTLARICDTRKTLPGLRGLEKYAVACGGGLTHRMGLHDAMLVKDNHLAHVQPHLIAEVLRVAINRARRDADLKFVGVEVDTLEQLDTVLQSRVDLVLLDNMSIENLTKAVAVRDQQGRGVELEASGGVDLDNVGAIARTGVDRISVGALTHSAPSLDFGLDFV